MHSSLAGRFDEPFWPKALGWRLALALAFAVGIGFRMYRLLDVLPVLVDEAIYLRWAEIIQHRHSWFVSLLDAKPPLSYWIYAFIRTAFDIDPLLGSRLVSVAAGVGSIALIYCVGYVCSGVGGGVLSALLYSVLPYAILYDRLGYTDALVNFLSLVFVWQSLKCFAMPDVPWRSAVVAGLSLGIGLFTKTTILMFAGAPLAFALYFHRNSIRHALLRVGLVYLTSAIFPCLAAIAVPDGPRPDFNNVLLHHVSFFTPLATLSKDPAVNLRQNIVFLHEYLSTYLTIPLLVAGALSFAILLVSRRWLPALIVLSCAVPFAGPLVMLEYFPSRYAFPHVWPILLVSGSALGLGPRAHSRVGTSLRAAQVLAAGFLLLTLSKQSLMILQDPRVALHWRDQQEFLGPGPYSGGGVREAVSFLRDEVKQAPLTILVDPWWGPPSDVVAAYLNESNGAKVYEAWWLQRPQQYRRLVPSGLMPVWRSQYERVSDGEVDFGSLPRLFYVTDTNYHTPEWVQASCPEAQLLKRFPKRSLGESIDVYRLR